MSLQAASAGLVRSCVIKRSSGYARLRGGAGHGATPFLLASRATACTRKNGLLLPSFSREDQFHTAIPTCSKHLTLLLGAL